MTVINMECRAGMMTLPDNSVDAIVTDPPYGLSKEPDMSEVLRHWLAGDDYNHGGSGFMGKSWDSFVPGPATWREALRVLKPGGHALVFAGSRTQDLMTTSLRLAGFEIRDTAMWLYGSGFPKSLNVGKQLPEREGYGTALKPAYEPIIIARKSLGGTVVETVLKYGTGALNIDGCRVPTGDALRTGAGGLLSHQRDGERSADARYTAKGGTDFAMKPGPRGGAPEGRWPANILHDGSDEVVDLFPANAGAAAPVKGTEPSAACTGAVTNLRKRVKTHHHNDGLGSAARFFYCAKASKADRDAGAHNAHPTVKPTELMRWCCRLVGHPGALILDPFTGSGSTGRGAVLEGFEFIGFQWDPEDPEGRMVDIANARINNAKNATGKVTL